MTTAVQKWGNSLGIRIEKDLARAQGLVAGTQVRVTAHEGAIRVERVKQSKKSLAELVRDITPGTIHHEEDWGAPQGVELW